MSKIIQAKDNLIQEAAKILEQGLVIFPTETVYGLGANASRPESVVKVYACKNRPSNNPLISHYSDLSKAFEDVVFTDLAYQIAAKFCPGPLTMVLKKNQNSRICDLARAGLDTAAIRIPSNPIARRLLALVNFPVVAPSANPSSYLSPVCLEHVSKFFMNKVDLIIDGGLCDIGLESTVLDLSNKQVVLLRPGKITLEELEDTLGLKIQVAQKHSTKRSPGMMSLHYAPKTPMRFFDGYFEANDALLAFGPEPNVDLPILRRNLSPRADLNEASKNFFLYLHELDEACPSAILVMPIPNHGIGRALNDKISRAMMLNQN